jgi:hypothetical protein
MEGSDASILIALRMGIDQKEVKSRLMALHQKEQLDGAASGLTDEDEEDFEKSESQADVTLAPVATTSAAAAPAVKVILKPAVLGAPVSTAPATAAPSATETTTQPTRATAKATTEALENEPDTMDLDSNSLSVGDLHKAVQEVVAQVNVAHKALATAGFVTAERSREALQPSKISGIV